MTDSFWNFAALAIAAFLAGIMNSIAGGGTLLTFPTLLTLLAPLGTDNAATLANGTSTVALLPGSIAGAFGYRKELGASRRFVIRLFLPSILGGFLGAWLVGQAKDTFTHLVPWLILTAALLFVVQAPISRWLRVRSAIAGQPVEHREPGAATQIVIILLQFCIAVYGGYFGAGIGILMLSALGFMGVGDIHRMNAVKTFLAAAINAASVVVFILADEVVWNYAYPMSIAAIAGGYAGARVARRLPAIYVRYGVIAIGLGLAIYYFTRPYL